MFLVTKTKVTRTYHQNGIFWYDLLFLNFHSQPIWKFVYHIKLNQILFISKAT